MANKDFGLEGLIQIDSEKAIAGLKAVDGLLTSLSKKLANIERQFKKSSLGMTLGKNVSRDISNAERLNKSYKRVLDTKSKIMYVDSVGNASINRNFKAPLTSDQIAKARAEHSQFLKKTRGFTSGEADAMASFKNYKNQAAIDRQSYSQANGYARKRISDEKEVTRELKKQQKAIERQKQSQQGFLDGLFNVKNALMLITASYMAKFVRDLIDVNNRLIAVDVRFKALAPNVGMAKEEMDWIYKRAKELRQPMLDAAEGYSKFYAAANKTLSQKDMRSVYDSLLQASTVMHILPRQFKLVSLAVEQMASKGTISMEELRRQLGEHIPGAFGIAARAMGKSEKEFNKMVKDGKVFANEFLPKFAKQLKQELGQGLSAALASSQSKIINMQNAIMELQMKLSESGFSEAIGNVADAITAVIQGDKFERTMKSLGNILLDISKQMKTIVPLVAFLINNIIGVSLIKAISSARNALILAFSATSRAATLSMGLWGLSIGLVSTLIYNNIDKVMNWLNRLQKWRRTFEVEGVGTISILFTHAKIALSKLEEQMKSIFSGAIGGGILGLVTMGPAGIIPGMAIGGYGGYKANQLSNNSNANTTYNYGGFQINTLDNPNAIVSGLKNNLPGSPSILNFP